MQLIQNRVATVTSVSSAMFQMLFDCFYKIKVTYRKFNCHDSEKGKIYAIQLCFLLSHSFHASAGFCTLFADVGAFFHEIIIKFCTGLGAVIACLST